MIVVSIFWYIYIMQFNQYVLLHFSLVKHDALLIVVSLSWKIHIAFKMKATVWQYCYHGNAVYGFILKKKNRQF